VGRNIVFPGQAAGLNPEPTTGWAMSQRDAEGLIPVVSSGFFASRSPGKITVVAFLIRLPWPMHR
jgi:hypothetical protein